MKGLVAITWRVLGEHRFVWIAAVASTCVPFLVPIARGMHGLVAEEARAATAVSLSLAFLYALSCFLAGTEIPVAIASRRVGFDFARPVSALAIWGGTLTAITLLAFGSSVLVALPAALVDPARFRDALGGLDAETTIPIGVWIAGSFLLAGLVQTASVALRSRSLLLAIDFVAFLILVFPALSVIPLLRLFAEAGALAAITGVAAVAVLSSTYAGLAAGRTDIRRAHAAQSLVLWFSVALAWLALAAGNLWLRSYTLQRVRSVGHVTAAPKGEWLAVEGGTGQIPVRFLLDSTSREFLRLNPGAEWATFSKSGQQAAWLESGGEKPVLKTVRLGEKTGKPQSLTLPWAGAPVMLILDSGGGRAAVSNGRDVTVLNLSDGRTIASASLARPETYLHGAFADDAVRILYASEISKELYRIELFSLDIQTSRLSHTGTVDAVDGWPYSFSTDTTGNRLLLKTRLGIVLADARDGRRIAVLSEAPIGSRDVTFVSDGRIVVAEQAAASGSLSCVTAEGASVWSVPLPKAPQVILGGEIRPGELVVGVGSFRDQRIFVANLAIGALRRIAEHMSPVAGWTWFFAPLDARPLPGEPATRLFYDPGDSLVRLDPETGEKTVLLGGATPK